MFTVPAWIDRQFSLGYSPGCIPFLIERLSTTAPRILDQISRSSEAEAEFKPGGKWSVKEHIGHLTDLEELHEGRLSDFQQRLAVLRPADMTNRKTAEAPHSAAQAHELYLQFFTARKHFISRLRGLDEACLEHRAMHPRLQQEMNVADMLYFMAEHDNHHLTVIAHILGNRR